MGVDARLAAPKLADSDESTEVATGAGGVRRQDAATECADPTWEDWAAHDGAALDASEPPANQAAVGETRPGPLFEVEPGTAVESSANQLVEDVTGETVDPAVGSIRHAKEEETGIEVCLWGLRGVAEPMRSRKRCGI